MHNLIPSFIHHQFEIGQFHGRFQAAALSVDISGFTSLTETLTRRQQVDVEFLTETLNDIFNPVVKETRKYGGIIPLFAGDAFTALFVCRDEFDDHVLATRRAIATAVYIQQFFMVGGQTRQVHTDFGSFALDIRIGLSFGPVEWGIPGEGDAYSFYFRGSAIRDCIQAQKQAQTGQILVDEMIMATATDHITADPLPNKPYHSLRGCSLDIPVPNTKPPCFSRESLAPFIPTSVLDLTIKAEFRTVCPVFLSFDTSDDMDAFHTFVTAVMSLARQYGGYFSQIDFSDKSSMFLILFGAPVTYDNQVERAADFLLALKREKMPVRWRAGITSGTVWAGIRGGAERCEYGIVGDVVNLAARLTTRAGWGEIWVSTAVYEQLKQAYWLSKLGTFSFKGKRDKTVVYWLLGKMETIDTIAAMGAMFGRARELEQLHKTVQPLLSRHFAGLIYIFGDAGMGKTWLVNEFQGQIMKNHFLNWFYCPTQEISQTSLHPFKHFLRDYFRQFSQFSPEENRANFDMVFDFLVQQLPAAEQVTQVKQELIRTRSVLAAMVDLYWQDSLYDRLEPKLRFENMLAAFKNFMKAQSLLRPVIMHIEDGHWLDPDSQQMIESLTMNMADYPIAILCTSRYEDDGQKVQFSVDSVTPAYQIELVPLLPADIKLLAESHLQNEVSADVIHFLEEKTSGNPYFVEQLLFTLQAQDLLDAHPEEDKHPYTLRARQRETVPSTINAVLVSRLDRLPHAVREVIQTAAVLGREFSLPILAHMLPTDLPLEEYFKIAKQNRIWYSLNEWRYSFTHGLLRDAAYNMQLRTRLRELHRLAGEAIQKVDAVNLNARYAELAFHYDRADMAQQAADWYRQAGEQAAAQYATTEALTYLNRALELIPETAYTYRFAILLIRERLYSVQGDREAQFEDLQTLAKWADLLDDKQKQAETAVRLAQYSETIGDYPGVIGATRLAAEFAQAIDDENIEATAYLSWGRALMRQGEYDVAQNKLNKALMLARSARLYQLEADSFRNFGIISVDQGEYEKARAYYENALYLYRKIGNRRGESLTFNNLGVISVDLRDYINAKIYYEQALRIHQEIGHRQDEAMALINLGTLYMDQGLYTEAQACNEKALPICREIGVRWGECYTLLNLALIHRYQNDHATARKNSEEALLIAEEVRGRRLAGYALNNLGGALMGLELFSQAEDVYIQALRIWQELDQPNLAMETHAGLSQTFMLSGKMAEAKREVEQILAHIDQGNSLDGTESPLGIYLACYLVLIEDKDLRAKHILEIAYNLLQEQAAKITDSETRQLFLENIKTHEVIMIEYNK